jgi:hypothetical protein
VPQRELHGRRDIGAPCDKRCSDLSLRVRRFYHQRLAKRLQSFFVKVFSDENTPADGHALPEEGFRHGDLVGGAPGGRLLKWQGRPQAAATAATVTIT